MHGARPLLTGRFWGDALERAISAGAASLLAAVGAGGLGLLDADWGLAGSLAGMAAVVSILKSVVASVTTDPETAGFTTTARR